MLNNIGITTNDQINSVAKETEFKTNSLRTIKYSYNPLITPQMSKDEAAKKTRGWLFSQISWEPTAVTEMVRTQSYIPSELKDGHKIKSNVKAVYNIILDFDNGTPTLQEFLSHVENFRFACVVHTTTNHQKLKKDSKSGKELPETAVDKFRVIIPLKEPISLSAYAATEAFWVKKFSTIDTTSFQGSRYFKVNPNAEVYFHYTYVDSTGATVEAEFLDVFKEKIILESFKKKQAGRSGKVVTEKYDGSFSIDDSVRLQDGTEIKFKNITGKTQVLCPFCDPAKRQSPDKHNAFADFNKAGQIYLYCSSEDKTFWSYTSEIVSERSSLFFNETVGYASRIDESGFVIFKNNDDWLNYCHFNDINPACKIFLPRVKIIFDPAKQSGLQKEYFNMFQESDYLKGHNKTQPLISGDEVLMRMEKETPVIYEIMMNLFGESEYLKGFLNWHAVILQHRIKLDTAWLITSKEEGIGKGLMFDRILQPLYGKRQSMLVLGNNMAKNFNSQDQNLWLKVFDEVYSPGNAKENLARKEWLKYIITAREQTIELKGIDSFQVQNHMNLILYSNNECPIFLGSKDRRFNVIRNENAKKTIELSFYRNNVDMQECIEVELERLADLLLSYDSDIDSANTAIDSIAKDKLKEVTADEYEEFAKALVDRDETFFLLSEVFPPSESDRMFAPGISISPEGSEVELAIKDGYIPAKSMGRLCKFHFIGHYKNILSRLRLKGIEKLSKKIKGTTQTVYTIR
ncbi:MAG: DUF5906 domain-containing protein [Ignavibacteriaceae bacterium]|nr:DUF5906 domain-containing protein [Ignavibacteriaceae bacterium]